MIGPTDGHDSHSAVFGAGGATDERDLEVRIANPMTAPIPMRPRATNQRDLALNKVLAGLGLFLDFVCFFIALGKESIIDTKSYPQGSHAAWLRAAVVLPRYVNVEHKLFLGMNEANQERQSDSHLNQGGHDEKRSGFQSSAR